MILTQFHSKDAQPKQLLTTCYNEICTKGIFLHLETRNLKCNPRGLCLKPPFSCYFPRGLMLISQKLGLGAVTEA